VAGSGFAQSNIVVNGSFETGASVDGWGFGGSLGVYPNSAAADGQVSVVVMTTLYQDLNTIPGRDYVLSYALQKSSGAPTVTWGGNPVAPFTNIITGDAFWQYRYVYVQASSDVTHLQFNAPGNIDDVKVGWLQEPIRILSQPQSLTGLEGRTATFSVEADGAPPLQYQWLFNGNPVPGGTNRVLVLTPLQRSQAGQYSVSIHNASGTTNSGGADLQIVPPATTPEIIFQPVGDICPQGYVCILNVIAVGAPPLSYQWQVNGTNIPAATNAGLRFESVQPSDGGAYSVLVSNYLGTAQSLPALLSVTNTSGGGRVIFDTTTNNAPIFDVDGVTRLSGSSYAAQLYAGPTPSVVRPVGPIYYFPVGPNAGFIKNISRTIPDVAGGQVAQIQVRAWETAAGASYEEARAAGGKFGFSKLLPTQTGTGTSLNRVPMQSFSLRAGKPFFITGKLSVGEKLPDGTFQLILTGEAGARYLIEKRFPPNNWTPFLTVTNATGTVLFTDPAQQQHTVQFYRSRILD